ncbi:MAG: RNA pseudouridine synthase [Alphaproteobacteria bacterium]|nr:RNA pseudouridine synthase [Alphaproteobacteria bacterium]
MNSTAPGRLPRIDLAPRLLHRDGLILVIDKPAGIPVHAGPGGGDNLERHFDSLRFGLRTLPALAHRLDRDTSGCLVLGRHRKALARLGRLFSEGRVGKTYWAVVHGKPPTAEGTIDLPLRKVTKKTGWRMIGDPREGQPARTDYRLMGSSDGLSWLELLPRTGRTHQIRVHCAAMGCPVLGDGIYGTDRDRPLHLHARRVVLPLQPSKPPVDVTAPVPPHMHDALAACGYHDQQA